MRWQWKHNTCLLFHQQCKMLASYCHCWIPLTLFSLCEKIVKWRQSAKTAKQIFKMPKRKQVIKFLTNHYKVSGLMPPKTLYSIIIGLDIDVHVHLHVFSVDFTRIDEIWKFDSQRFRKSFLCTCLPWINIHVMMKLIVGQHTTSVNKSYHKRKMQYIFH